MTVLDTSVLIDSLSGQKRLAPALRRAIAGGERILIPSLVLYEWLRGPRLPEEVAAQEALFPSESAIAFGPREAALSAKLYRSLHRPADVRSIWRSPPARSDVRRNCGPETSPTSRISRIFDCPLDE